MAQVRFCDVASLRIILGSDGDGHQPARAQTTLYNLAPYLDSLRRLLRDAAPDLANNAASQAGISTVHSHQAARPQNDGSAATRPSTLNEPTPSPPPAAEAGQGCLPGQEIQPVPEPAVPGRHGAARSYSRRADA